jgi:uncharacterized protein (TIGR03118 family)
MFCRTASLAVLIATLACGCIASAASIYSQTNLTSDVPGLAFNLDPDLKNPWGMSFSPTSPFWVSNQVTSVATLYNAAGVKQGLVVATPPGPTGQIFNSTAGFELTPGNPSRFVFASLSGNIAGWNPAVNPNTAITMFTATDGAVYTGLANGTIGSEDFLYAADTANGKIDVINSSFEKTVLAGSFTDPLVPSGFTPYNIQNVGGKLYVTYAIEDTPGGFIGVFDLNGNFLQHISDPHLNGPWAVALAPPGFGSFGNTLLIGNEGDGTINGFDPITGDFLGTLMGTSGPIVNEALWAIAFRQPGSGFDPNTLYFVAGINDEENGLFGTIQASAIPEPATAFTATFAMSVFALIGFARRFVNKVIKI